MTATAHADNLVHDLCFAHIAPSLCQVSNCGLACLYTKHATRFFLLCWKYLQGGACCVHGILSSSKCCVCSVPLQNVSAVCSCHERELSVVLYSCVGCSGSMEGSSLVQACVYLLQTDDLHLYVGPL